jgi:hypothetical protein
MELQSHSSHSYYYYELEERTDGRTDETSGLTTCPLNRVRLRDERDDNARLRSGA